MQESSDLDSIPLYRVDSKPEVTTNEVSVLYSNFKNGGNKTHIPCSNKFVNQVQQALDGESTAMAIRIS
jgi:hypothetical protein